MSRVNIAIIGSGPAGISAAITAKARNQEILLFGMGGQSEKVGKAHKVRNYPGLPDITGEDFQKAFEKHLEAMEISITEEQVTNIYTMGDYFAIQTPENMYESETLILATGVNLGKALPGESEFLGKGVSYCATCDAFFYRKKPVAVLGYNEESVEEAKFLATTSSKVYYLSMKGDASFEEENIEVVSGKPLEISGDVSVNTLKTTEGDLAVDGVFILRDAVNPAILMPGVLMDGEHVKVNLQMETNVKGCYACGDIAGKPYQYIKGAGQGNVAALSAVNYLTAKKAQNKQEQ